MSNCRLNGILSASITAYHIPLLSLANFQSQTTKLSTFPHTRTRCKDTHYRATNTRFYKINGRGNVK